VTIDFLHANQTRPTLRWRRRFPYVASKTTVIETVMRSYARYNRRLAEKYYEWMIAMHYRPCTRVNYRRALNLFIDYLGPRSVTKATHYDIREHIVEISRQGKALRTTYSHLCVLRAFYDFLTLGGVSSYAAPRFLRLRYPRIIGRRILGEPQVQKLIDATRTLRERALIEFFYGTGCRLREATHLKVGDVDLEARTAQINGKGGRLRVVLLTKAAAEAVRAYLGDRTSGYVFRQHRPIVQGSLTIQHGLWIAQWRDYSGPGPRYPKKLRSLGNADAVSQASARAAFGALLKDSILVRPAPDRPLSHEAVRATLRNVGRRACVGEVSPHMLRRTFAAHLYDHGAGIEVVQKLLGHTSFQTTLLYTGQGTGRLTETFERCHPRAQIHEPEARQQEANQAGEDRK